MQLLSLKTAFPAIFDPLPTLEPGQEGMIRLHLQTPQAPGTYNLSIVFVHNNQEISVSSAPLELVPPPSVTIQTQLGWQKTSSAEDVTILVYDNRENLLHKFPGLRIEENRVHAAGLTNIVPGRAYRIVVLAPYYLPRQIIAPLGGQETALTLPRFYPLDFNDDGALTFGDLPALLTTQPQEAFRRFFTP